MTDPRAVVESFNPREYPDYARLTELVQAFAAAYPELCTLAAIGTSPEGRSIWALTLTNRATGPDQEKPGYFLEANIHAGEVTGSAVALYTVHYLLTGYGREPRVTQLLDSRAFYVVPRISVDGAEFFLKTPYLLRSAPRLWPVPEEQPGWHPEDIDGDGRILLLRVPDPLGEWKVSDQDPRLMLRREPGESGGTYYRVLLEGLYKERSRRGTGEKGAGLVPAERLPDLRPAPRRWGLDFNRSYPAHWQPEGEQPGAGRYPLSEPETRAVAEFVTAHRNIGGYVALHTFGGIYLRPPAMGSDDLLPAEDLALYQAFAEVARQHSGYPTRSTHAAFAVRPDQPLVKGADDWAYEHLGLMAYTIECWDLDGRAGARGYAQIGMKGLLELTEAQQVEDELKRLRWNDEHLAGRGFVRWRPFEHPQLGRVEIGGWEQKFCLQNPPPELLPEESARHCAFLIDHALAMPELAVGPVEVEALGGDLYKVAAAVENRGYLATNVTAMALRQKTDRPVVAELELPEGARLVAGQARQELGHLAGSGIPPAAWGPPAPARNRIWAEWVVQGPAGSRLAVTARSPRAGVARAAAVLEGGGRKWQRL